MPLGKHMHLHRRQGAGNPLQQLGNDLGNAINQVGQEIGNAINGDNSNKRGGDDDGHGHHHDDNSSQGLENSDHLEVRDINKRSGDAATLFSVVFVTQKPTFSGPVQWSTIAPSPAPSKTLSPVVPVPVKSSSAPAVTSAAAASTNPPSKPPPTTASPTQQSAASSQSLIDTISTTPTLGADASSSASDDASPTAGGSGSTAADGSSVSGASASNTSSPSLTATNSQQSSGLSTGAKVGIAFGVIIGVLALAALAFAAWRLKKNRDQEAYEREASEKGPFSDRAAAPAPTQAPLAAPVMSSTTALGSTAYGAGREADRASIGTPVNPFGAGAVPVAPKAADPDANSLDSHDAEKAAFAAGAGAVTAATLARRTSIPTPLKVNNRSQSPALAPPPVLASPTASQFSETSMTSADAAGIGGPPKMHRVQMDFNPTMEDELHIKAGEIVRIIREFDDGWCSVELIQRNKAGDVMRHQQGVCPRTCLSRLPLKPRQKRTGPPIAQPCNDSPSPMATDNKPRSTSPALHSNAGKRSMSPDPYGGGPEQKSEDLRGRSRSNSAGDAPVRRAGGHGPSPMNPAAQAAKDFDLPIQLQSPLEKPPSLGHGQSKSIGSMPSSPVTRKPVPNKAD